VAGLAEISLPRGRVSHHKDTPGRGQSDREEGVFLDGVIWVAEGDRQGVLKNGECLLERGAMLLVVRFDDHRASLYPLVSGLANTPRSAAKHVRLKDACFVSSASRRSTARLGSGNFVHASAVYLEFRRPYRPGHSTLTQQPCQRAEAGPASLLTSDSTPSAIGARAHLSSVEHRAQLQRLARSSPFVARATPQTGCTPSRTSVGGISPFDSQQHRPSKGPGH
jgi:hypothetical protein